MDGRTTNIVLGVIALSLGLACLGQYVELRALRADVVQLQEQAANLPPAVKEDAPAPAAPEPAQPSVAPAPEVAPDFPSGEVKKIPIKKRPYEELIQMLKDPNRRKFMEASWTLQMDSMYGPLFRYYEMTPEELQYMHSLLVEKWSLAEDHAARRLEAGADGTALAEALAVQNKVENEFSGRVREFLGDDAYEEYEGYNESLPERVMLADFKRSMENTSLPLSYSQEDALIRIMYEERENQPSLRQMMRINEAVPQMGLPRTETVLREFDAERPRIISRAAGVLAPEQLGSFTNYVSQLRDTLEVGLTLQSTVLSPK